MSSLRWRINDCHLLDIGAEAYVNQPAGDTFCKNVLREVAYYGFDGFLRLRMEAEVVKPLFIEVGFYSSKFGHILNDDSSPVPSVPELKAVFDKAFYVPV